MGNGGWEKTLLPISHSPLPTPHSPLPTPHSPPPTPPPPPPTPARPTLPTPHSLRLIGQHSGADCMRDREIGVQDCEVGVFAHFDRALAVGHAADLGGR